MIKMQSLLQNHGRFVQLLQGMKEKGAESKNFGWS